LISAARLSDVNAANIYQLIKKKISQGNKRHFDIKVDELKDELNLYTKRKKEKIYAYERFKDFNRKVIKKSLDTISKTTEVTNAKVDIIEKKGRKAYLLRVSYEINNQFTLKQSSMGGL
jgi:hypothetical protein